MAALTRFNTINYEVFTANGTRLLGTSNITLPNLENMDVTIKGAGISGEITAPTIGHFKSLEVELNWRTIHSDLTMFSMQRATDILLYGAMENYDHGTGAIKAEQVKIQIRGLPKSAEFGKFEPAAETESKSKLEIITMKIDVASKNIVNIDKINFICVVNGVDYLAETRNALNI